MRTTEHRVPGVVYDGTNMVKKDLIVRITKSSWATTLSISDDDKIMLHIQLDHPNILKRLKEVLR